MQLNKRQILLVNEIEDKCLNDSKLSYKEIAEVLLFIVNKRKKGYKLNQPENKKISEVL